MFFICRVRADRKLPAPGAGVGEAELRRAGLCGCARAFDCLPFVRRLHASVSLRPAAWSTEAPVQSRRPVKRAQIIDPPFVSAMEADTPQQDFFPLRREHRTPHSGSESARFPITSRHWILPLNSPVVLEPRPLPRQSNPPLPHLSCLNSSNTATKKMGTAAQTAHTAPLGTAPKSAAWKTNGEAVR